MSIVATPTFSVVRSSTVSLSVSSSLSNTCSNVRQPFQCRITIVNQDMKVLYFSRIIAGAIISFSAQKGAIIQGKAIISNSGQWKSCSKNFFFIMPLNQKLITSNLLNVGCPGGYLRNF